MPYMFTHIRSENNIISVWNNGRGIPVEMHATEKMYVPELIFGTLLTSSNYDDDQKKVTGGRNGYGAKLCNIFSTDFTIETACSESGKVFKQVNGWRLNPVPFLVLEKIFRGMERKVNFKSPSFCLTYFPMYEYLLLGYKSDVIPRSCLRRNFSVSFLVACVQSFHAFVLCTAVDVRWIILIRATLDISTIVDIKSRSKWQ